MQDIRHRNMSPDGDDEAWILGSGISSLASAFYLITKSNIRPFNIHILEQQPSLEEAVHHNGDSSSGYDQFAACLPVPIGSPMNEFLSAIPSREREGQSLFDEIQSLQANRLSPNRSDRTQFLECKDGYMHRVPVESINLSCKYRASLVRLLLRRENSITQRPIRDMFPSGFFDTTFWLIWSAQ